MRKLAASLVFFFSSLPVLAALAQPDVQATPTNALERDVVFYSGEVPIAATMSIPAGRGPFPAVVIVHGSGTSDRTNPWTSAYAAALLERGVAVLHPDKRGSGDSGGDWRTADFERLADDALAGIDLLRGCGRIDSARIGLIGFSQGGHVVPVAAARSSRVAFVINISGSVVPMAEQVGDELRMMGARAGLPDTALHTIETIHQRAMSFLGSPDAWQEYEEALNSARESDLAGSELLAGFPTSPDDPAWDFLRMVSRFDPLPYWSQVRAPVLFVYGGLDRNVDVYKSMQIIESELRQAPWPYDLLFFEENGHALFREDALDFMSRWISHVGLD